MKLAFKVLLLIALIIIGRMEKQNRKSLNNLYSPVYSQNTQASNIHTDINTRINSASHIQKISLKYSN